MTKSGKEPPKMSIRLPGQADKPEDKEAAALEFISGAPGGSLEPKAELAPVPEAEEILPWEEPGIRADVVKQYNLRLPEPDLLKLRYVVEKQRARSINSYILEILLPKLEEDLLELTGRK